MPESELEIFKEEAREKRILEAIRQIRLVFQGFEDREEEVRLSQQRESFHVQSASQSLNQSQNMKKSSFMRKINEASLNQSVNLKKLLNQSLAREKSLLQISQDTSQVFAKKQTLRESSPNHSGTELLARRSSARAPRGREPPASNYFTPSLISLVGKKFVPEVERKKQAANWKYSYQGVRPKSPEKKEDGG